MGCGVVAEANLRAVSRNREWDIGAITDAALTIVLIPALVDRDFALIRAGRNSGCLERVDPVAVEVLEPGAQAVRLPIARAAELALEAAGRDGDRRVFIIGDP